MIFLFLLQSLTLLGEVFCGTLAPKGGAGVSNTLNNIECYSDYTFEFIPDNDVPESGYIEVLFPQQYQYGLGIDIITDQTCSVPCFVSGRTIVFQIVTKIKSGTVGSVFINQVLNPATIGATGNFQLRTRRGDYVIDENLIFGTIGIGSDPKKLLSTYIALSVGESAQAGDTSKYTLYFKTPTNIPYTSYMIIEMPKNSKFTVPAVPNCDTYYINGKRFASAVTCKVVNNKLKISGLTQDIPADFEVGITFFLTNPPVAGLTSNFFLYIFRENTQTVYSWRIDIAGVNILPGLFPAVVLERISDVTASRGKIMDYRLSFRIKNKTPFDFDYVEIISGLQDPAPRSPVGLVFDANSITITNFQTLDPLAQIGINIRAINPGVSGQTESLIITSYTDSLGNVIIDQDSSSARIAILDYPSSALGLPLGIITTSNIASASPTVYKFTFTPSVLVPASGKVVLSIPTNITLASAAVATDCLVDSAGTASQACTLGTQKITITLGASSSYAIGAPGYLTINNIIKTSSVNGTYPIDITTYGSDGVTILESFTDFVTFLPNTFALTLELLGKERTNPPNNKFSIMILTFNAPADINSGEENSWEKMGGFLEVVFKTGNWPDDLGKGLPDNSSVPCLGVQGMLPDTGKDLICTLFLGSLKYPPRIVLRNFLAVTSATPCKVHIPKLLNPSLSGASNIEVQIGYYLRRVKVIQYSNLASINIDPFATSPSADVTITYTINPNTPKVSTDFDLNFNPSFTSDIASGEYVVIEMPTWEDGFTARTSPTCKIRQLLVENTYTCVVYKEIDWILIFINTNLLAANTPLFKLFSLNWPRSSYQAPKGIKSRIIKADHTEKEIRTLNSISLPSPSAFDVAKISVSKKGLGFVDVLYTFTFKSTNKYPRGSVLELTFPTAYDLLSSIPVPSFATNLTASPSESIVYAIKLNVLTVSNFVELAQKTPFYFNVSGVKNPASGSASTGWKISAKTNGYAIEENLNFDTFNYEKTFSPGIILWKSIAAFPTNANSKAIYTLSFTPKTEIPASGLIYVVFPSSDYTYMPAVPECQASGSLSSIKSCAISGSTFIVETFDKVLAGSDVTIKIREILNPQNVGDSKGFRIETRYDGLLLDFTDESTLNSRVVTISEAAGNLSILQFYFDPKNEGERSTYTISIQPLIYLEASSQIVVGFPLVYDALVGKSVTCSVVSGMIAELVCRTVDRMVFISNLGSYVPGITLNPLVISITGVINPNRISNSNSNYFLVATKRTNDGKYLESNQKAFVLESDQAPGWIYLYSILASNFNTRLKTDYLFNLTISESLPPAAFFGKIYIDFPTQFDIKDKSLTCDSPTSGFSSLTCSIASNRVTVQGNSISFSGILLLYVRGINNPIESGQINNIYVKTYDGFRKKILETSFLNTDPFVFSYTHPGPIITVNGDADNVTVYSGHQSNPILITLVEPCLLNLSFKSSTTGLNVVPSSVDIKVGDYQSSFSIAAGQSIIEGTYYIYWETLNELTPAMYTALKKTPIHLKTISESTRVPVIFSEILEIPREGNSLPITISVANSPATDIQISFFTNSSYKGLIISPSQLKLESGKKAAQFLITIASTFNGTKGLINVSLTGTNKDSFKLIKDFFEVTTRPSDPTPPSISEVTVSEILKTAITLSVRVTKPSQIYYMIALGGTDEPPFVEVREQGPPPYLSTLSQYGKFVIASTLVRSIKITGLTAQRNYSIYVYAESQEGVNSSIKTASFITANKDLAAEISIRLDQPSINSDEKVIILRNLAFVSASRENTLIEKKDYFKTESTQSSSKTVFTAYFIARDDTDIFPPPLKLGQTLNARGSLLKKYINNFDESYMPLFTREFIQFTPEWKFPPQLSNFTWQEANIKVALSTIGFVFGIAVKNSTDRNVKPYAAQIMAGLNSRNLVLNTSFSFIEIENQTANYSLKISNLDQLSTYYIFLIGASTHPNNPDLMSYESIQNITVTTLEKPKPKQEATDSVRVSLALLGLTFMTCLYVLL